MVSGLSMPPSNLEQLGQRKKKYYGGAGIGRFILDENVGQENAVQCLYDMVLVERVQGRPPTDSGLFVPQEDLPKLHVCRGKDERERGGQREREGGTHAHTHTQMDMHQYIRCRIGHAFILLFFDELFFFFFLGTWFIQYILFIVESHQSYFILNPIVPLSSLYYTTRNYTILDSF